MKIRMKDNSLRLRLTQTEVERFGQDGKVSSTTQLGPKAEQKLTYSLVKDAKGKEATASYEANEIIVYVPEPIAADWIGTDRVGFEGNMALEKGEHLFILVEKDFKCLQVRPHEDESDAFPNPMEGQVC